MAVKLVSGIVLLASAVVAVASVSFGPDSESFGPAQTAADYIKTAAKADIAFLPAGVLRANFKPGELSGLLQFPTDDVSVVTMTGAQVKQALERSVALYPSPNPGFLQVSGLQITFSKSAPPNKRLVTVTLSGANIEDGKKYKVAMPGSLARGGLGYFTVWEKGQITETLGAQNLESILKGKSGTDSQPRWRAVE